MAQVHVWILTSRHSKQAMEWTFPMESLSDPKTLPSAKGRNMAL